MNNRRRWEGGNRGRFPSNKLQGLYYATLLIDEGHKEWLTSANMGILIEALEDNGYNVDTNTTGGRITPDLLRKYGILVLGTPWGDFQPKEIQAIVDYVRGGGGLLVTGVGWSYIDYVKRPLKEAPFNRITTHFGVFFDKGIICDPTDHRPEGKCTPVFRNITPHPVTKGVTAVTCKGCNPGPLKVSAGTVLIKGDEDSYCTYGAPPCSDPPFMAAIEFGLGRIIALGHEGPLVDGVSGVRSCSATLRDDVGDVRLARPAFLGFYEA